jgi:organic radical activating enzyme
LTTFKEKIKIKLVKILKSIGDKKYHTDMLSRRSSVDDISETFCTAKWLQVSLLLQNGTNHSCHHPPQHKIDINEIKINPSALHNTKEKKEERKLMLSGERPVDCSYCWDIEDMGKKYISDRMIKSTDLHWSMPYLEKIKKNEENINPTYLEVAFENTCNLTCAYCSPDISSSWHQEIRKFGAYPTRYKQGDLDWIEKNGRTPIKNKDNNDYVEAFWKWWPDLYTTLKVFRITGGEPLLSSSTWKVLSLINGNPKKDLILSINTNLSVKDSLIQKLITSMNEISPKIKQIEIHTSCEATNKQAEYIRYGLNYQEFLENIEKVLKNTNDSVKVNLMITFNILSCSTFISLLGEIKGLRKKYKRKYEYVKLTFMVSILKWPSHLSVRVLPLIEREKFVKEIQEYLKVNNTDRKGGFLQIAEIDQINRLCEYMSEDNEDLEIEKDRDDFKKFIVEYDIRKKTNFGETFPTLDNLFFETNKGTND